MGRKEEQARREGISFAVRYLENHSKEELIEEAKQRAAYNIPVAITDSEMKDFETRVKSMTIDTMLVLSLITLRDEFDFGQKRIERFRDRFMSKCECLADGWTTWSEQLETLKEELNLEIEIRYNNKR